MTLGGEDRRATGATSERGRRTRETIARAAEELFLEQGYEGTTMRAVATIISGVSRAIARDSAS